jgi:hypothetical protein
VGDQPRPAKWIKFVGINSSSWKKTIEQVTIETIPFAYVDEIRFHFDSGRTYVHSTTTLSESKIEEIIEKVVRNNRDLTAIEYVIDLDRLHHTVTDQVKHFLEGSKE